MSLARVPGVLRDTTHFCRSRGLLTSLSYVQQRANSSGGRGGGRGGGSSSSSGSSSANTLAKYREKLDQKAREEGHPDIDSLRNAYAERIRDVRRRADAALISLSQTPAPYPSPPPPAAWPSSAATQATGRHCHPFPPSPPSTFPPPPPPPPPSSSAATAASASAPSSAPPPSSRPPAARPLDSMIDVAKARSLAVTELTAVWRLRHAADPKSLCAVIPAHVYAAMDTMARAAPQFVLPVPVQRRRRRRHAPVDGSGGGAAEVEEEAAAEEEGNQGAALEGGSGGGGAEMHFLQWTWDVDAGTSTVLFTQLAEYKARGEWAAPHTTITHHSDFAADRGAVLMQGAVATDRGVKVEDAQWLVMCLQRFYGQLDERKGASELAREGARTRRQLVEWFARGDGRFTVEKLMEEAERMG